MAHKRIWVDGQCFQTTSNVRGIGRYVAELLRAIHERGGVQLVISLNANMRGEAIAARRFLEAWIPGVDIQIWFGTANEAETRSGYSPSRQADERILAEHVRALAPDLALSPSLFEGFHDLSVPLVDVTALTCPTACIFHDAIPHRFPERYFHHLDLAKGYYRRLMAVRHFDLVLCNSCFTAAELADILDRHDGVTIGAGLASAFVEAMTQDDAVMEPALPARYVLHVGGLDWRKNIPTLIDAMALLPDTRSGALSLVLVGSGGQTEVSASRRSGRG
jgi:glycosyltransferase involved in cell wall biosynthesis